MSRTRVADATVRPRAACRRAAPCRRAAACLRPRSRPPSVVDRAGVADLPALLGVEVACGRAAARPSSPAFSLPGAHHGVVLHPAEHLRVDDRRGRTSASRRSSAGRPCTAVTANFLPPCRALRPGLLHRLLVARPCRPSALLLRHLLGDVDEDAVGVVQLERLLAADCRAAGLASSRPRCGRTA